MSFGWLEAGLLVSIGVVALARFVWREHTRHIRKSQSMKQDFFTAACSLVADDRTPDQLVDIIDFMAPRINHAKISRAYLLHLWSGRAREIERNPSKEQQEVIDTIGRLPPDLHQTLCQAAGAGLLSSSYRDFSFGWLMRRTVRIWAANIDDRRRKPPVVSGSAHIRTADMPVMVVDVDYARQREMALISRCQ